MNLDRSFIYRVGETVSVDDFDNNRWNECAPASTSSSREMKP